MKLTAPLKCHLPTSNHWFSGASCYFQGESKSNLSQSDWWWRETECVGCKTNKYPWQSIDKFTIYIPQLLSMNTLLKNNIFTISRLPWHVYQKTPGISWAFWTTNLPGWISAMQTAGFSLQLVLWPPRGRCLRRMSRGPSRNRRKEVLFPGKQKGYKQYVRIYNYVYV